MNLADQKAELRRRFRAQRDGLSPAARAAASDHIRQRLLELPRLAQAESVFVYVSRGSEVQTLTLIEDLLAAGKQVCVPRIGPRAKGTMQAVPIDSLAELPATGGRFGLLEPPATARAAPRPPAVTVLPGLAISPATGHRLGYGGGYFDRWLAAAAGRTYPIAVAYEQQLHDPLPIEPTDVSAAVVVTDQRVIWI